MPFSFVMQHKDCEIQEGTNLTTRSSKVSRNLLVSESCMRVKGVDC